LSADGASVERPRATSSRCARSQSSSAQHSLQCRSQRPARRSERRAAPPPLSTPMQSRASAPGLSSSKGHMRWERDPTRSRSQRLSEPRQMHVSHASRLCPSHPSSRTRAAAGSPHNGDSLRCMRDCGFASTTPSTPPAHRHSWPCSPGASRSSYTRLTP